MNNKTLWVGLLVFSSLVFAQSAPKAVLLRLEPDSTVIVGALEGSKWASGDTLSSTSQTLIKSGLKTTLLGSSGALGKAMAGGRIERYPEGDPCDWVRTTSISTPVKLPVFPAYALHASWTAVPRAIQTLPLNNATYQKLMADELKKRKISAPVIMTQILKTDLDNDKTDEVILVAQRPKVSFDDRRMLESKYESAAGDYSLVLVRKVTRSGVKTFVLGERVIKKLFDGTNDGQPIVLTQYVTAIADIDGDGKMEVFLDDYVHEGLGVTIYGWDGRGFSKKLEWGCGV
jgi:hypothetical protein